jgi:hypothetical protein
MSVYVSNTQVKIREVNNKWVARRRIQCQVNPAKKRGRVQPLPAASWRVRRQNAAGKRIFGMRNPGAAAYSLALASLTPGYTLSSLRDFASR